MLSQPEHRWLLAIMTYDILYGEWHLLVIRGFSSNGPRCTSSIQRVSFDVAGYLLSLFRAYIHGSGYLLMVQGTVSPYDKRVPPWHRVRMKYSSNAQIFPRCMWLFQTLWTEEGFVWHAVKQSVLLLVFCLLCDLPGKVGGKYFITSPLKRYQ